MLGTYTLEYTYRDQAGNTGNIVTRTVHVVDTTAPVITRLGEPSLEITQGSGYVDA